MLSERELSAAIGSPVHGRDGEKIGTVEHFFVDDRTGAPTWVAVLTGLLGSRQSVAPAVDASFADGALRLPVSREAVRHAPAVDGTHLDPAQEAALRQHYSLDTPGPAGDPTGPWTPTGSGVVPAGATADDDTATGSDGAMTRSEEQLRVGTERVAATRVRLVKYVVTEEVQITVPVRREEIRVENVPVDAADPGPGESLVPAPTGSGEAGGALPDEIVLHAEKPVVTVEVVPVERVRLRTELVEGKQTVTEQVQRERIAVEQSPAG
jgi:stress response protein YsnF